MTSEVLLAEPRGFCAGVDRAIDIVEHALTKFGRPIYVRHEIVHNTYVVDDLKKKGAIFIEELADVPPGATLIFSAHGVSRAIQEEAERRGFRIFDATCPLVSKVHVELAKLHKEGYEFIMIGHKGHPEVEGTMGQLDSGIHLVEDVEDVAKVQPAQTDLLAVVTQTTLSVDDAAEIVAAVKARFPQVREPKQQDICYATQNRQDAVKLMTPLVDVVIVVGSPTSSNSNRLRELADRLGTPAYMAPEQLLRKPFDHRADVFAFGVSAYELLTGRKPFGGDSPDEILRRQLDRSIDFVPPRELNADIPAGLERAILKCLERDMEKRYPVVSVLVHDLQTALYV